MASCSKATPSWQSLVRRSIEAWEPLPLNRLLGDLLKHCSSLEDFLEGNTAGFTFWFFQRRDPFLSQQAMRKWSRDRLDDYILLPAANGYVSRLTCFFVSHFWRSQNNPDPDGKYSRLLQKELGPQSWEYIWVDWTCMPQSPRTTSEEAYFGRTLQTMSGIIRNSGFIWFYPPFEPRLWILYEIAEYSLTCDGGVDSLPFPDIKEYINHIQEMVQNGVRSTLDRHGYRCTYDRDKTFLISWLELLILVRKLGLDTVEIRQLLDHLTWHSSTQNILINTASGQLHLCRFEGTLDLNGVRHTFTPFPRWHEGKYATKDSSSPSQSLTPP